MIKFRWYYDKDDEEKFLNDMSAKGYAMKRFFLGIYWFDKCNPNEYTYRVDIINDKNKLEKKEFYDIVNETGAELVQTWGIWAFFRKKGSNFELYTDNESRINQYKRINRAFLSVGIFEVLLTINLLYNCFAHDIKSSIHIAILAIILDITIFYQSYKCIKKISKLKNEL